MALTFYYGSGSNFAWKVWLALEHKEIPYELKVLSFAKKETRSPDYLAINPRGKVPTIIDQGFALWESNAIVEYLEERYPQKTLFPGGANTKAIVRRIVSEVDNYLHPSIRKLMEQTFYRPAGAQENGAAVELAKQAISEELSRFSRYAQGDFFVGQLSAADFAIYPSIRLLPRVDEKFPHIGATSLLGSQWKAWMKRIESLPYFEKTVPPHWKEG